ncbi:MAG: PTS lactose/cellobiose transporter subunit IIA [Sarcina sp.]
MTELERSAMEIICASGDARGASFAALRLARKGQIEEARAKLKESKEKGDKGHNAQSALIMKEAQGDGVELNLLMVHAQDHLMTSLLAYDLIEEMVEMLADRK